ncbi:NAD(P)-binding protein [Roridomyces roridus]|uniref:NAD(P)-binding protein n=1 Tax=Roridomyces roridus TaxID=1738132 RepID=A0AAD7AYQ6_9AGAR|nr:NAD(P)-binding protein [Roridomyces roridus]
MPINALGQSPPDNMTITDTVSAPLVAVVGATGIQGGSVIKALEESDKAYRIRGFTRDASKPTAQALASRGVEVVSVSLVVGNKDEVYKAFEGANMIFHMNAERETAEAKQLFDAAKASGAERIVWSGLVSFDKISGGKFPHVYHFEGKAAATEYGRQIGAPFVDVQAGFYAVNMIESPMAHTKLEDGSLALEWPVPPTTRMPIIDAAYDYGLYVRHVFELPVFPSGSEVRTAGEMIAAGDIAGQLGELTGKKVVFKQITTEDYGASLRAFGLPPHIVEDLVECWVVFAEYGFYGTKEISSHEGLARKPRTWKEFVKSLDQ